MIVVFSSFFHIYSYTYTLEVCYELVALVVLPTHYHHHISISHLLQYDDTPHHHMAGALFESLLTHPDEPQIIRPVEV